MKRTRRLHSQDWPTQLKNDRKIPRRGSPAHDDYLGWRFFDDQVPGLPMARSAEGIELIARAERPS